MAQQYTYVDINFPGASSTTPTGVNDSGKVVGYWEDNDQHDHGFYWDGTNYSNIDYPGASDTRASGINNAGEISGVYWTNAGGSAHGFTLSDGTYTEYEVPGFSGQTNGAGLNNTGETTGYYNYANPTGFLNQSGTFTSFNYPQAQITHGNALNDYDQIVGDYQGRTRAVRSAFFMRTASSRPLSIRAIPSRMPPGSTMAG